jgi:NADPH-dependent curcumin reductase CurA
MTVEKNRQILLASRPHGEPSLDNFKLVETAVPEAGPGQMLLVGDPNSERSHR